MLVLLRIRRLPSKLQDPLCNMTEETLEYHGLFAEQDLGQRQAVHPQVEGGIDLIAPLEILKQVFRTPYSLYSPVSITIQLVEGTLVLSPGCVMFYSSIYLIIFLIPFIF